MAKFYGIIGFAISKETAPGVWIDEVVEVEYSGDVLQNKIRWNNSGNVNPNFTISDTISIIADGFILSNAHVMKYVKWRGAAWAITNIDIQRPRVLLALGGLYSGETASSS